MEHSKFFCLQEKQEPSLDALIEALSTGHDIEQPANDSSSPVEHWSSVMNGMWSIFCKTCPAGLARQMQVRVASDGLQFITHQVANKNCVDPEEYEHLK